MTGLLGVVLYAVVATHYMQVEWTSGGPAPLLWWRLSIVAVLVGAPLLLVALGRWAGRRAALGWGRLLLTWTMPGLLLYVLWSFATIAVVRRFNPGFAGLDVHDPVLLLPPTELSLPYALALLPALAKLTARAPAPLVLLALAGLAILTPVAGILVFLLLGTRLPASPARAVAGRELLERAAVAVAGVSVLGVPHFPEGLSVVVAGLAALPLARGLAARGTDGPVPEVAPVLVFLLPGLAVADALLVSRLSTASGTAQLVAALTVPPVLTACIVGGGALVAVVLRRTLPRAVRFRFASPDAVPSGVRKELG